MYDSSGVELNAPDLKTVTVFPNLLRYLANNHILIPFSPLFRQLTRFYTYGKVTQNKRLNYAINRTHLNIFILQLFDSDS